MLTFIPAEQRQVVLFDCKLLEEFYQFEYLGSKLIASGQNNKEIINRTTLSRLLPCLWRRRELSLHTFKGSGVLNSALRLQGVASTSRRRKGPRGYRKWNYGTTFT